MAHIVYDALLGAGNNLRQVQSVNYNPGPQVRRARQSGAIDPSEHYLLGADPRATLVTTDIAGLLAFAGVAGGSGLLSADTIYLPFQAEDNGGTFKSGLNHDRLAGTKGIVYPVSFQANQGDVVTANAEVVFLSTDGFTAPVALNTGVALQAGAFVGEYLFGDVYFGGSQVGEAVGWQVNTGISVATKPTNGAVYPTNVYITMRDPTITITFENFAAASSFVTAVGAMTTGAVYGRLLVDGGTLAADIATSHLKFSFGTGIGQLDNVQMQAGQQGTVNVTLLGEALAASTASAIP